MAKKQIVASTFNVTAAPEDGAKGSRGQLPYPILLLRMYSMRASIM